MESFTWRLAEELAARNRDGPDAGALGDIFESAAEEASETFTGSTESSSTPIDTDINYPSYSGGSGGSSGGVNIVGWIFENLDLVIIGGILLYLLSVTGPLIELLAGVTGE